MAAILNLAAFAVSGAIGVYFAFDAVRAIRTGA